MRTLLVISLLTGLAACQHRTVPRELASNPAMAFVAAHNRQDVSSMLELLVFYDRRSDRNRISYLYDLSRWITVVQQRVKVAKALCRKQLFVIKAAIGFTKLHMSFLRDLTELVINRHL